MEKRKCITAFIKKGRTAVAALLALALMLSLVPARTVKAADKVAKAAEKALEAIAEEFSIERAKAGAVNEVEYSLYDLNEDGMPELFCSYYGDDENVEMITNGLNLRIYTYNAGSGKVELAKKIANISTIKLHGKKIVVLYNTFDKESGFATAQKIAAYVVNSLGKVKAKARYVDDYEKYICTRNGKEITENRFYSYYYSFLDYEDFVFERTSDAARPYIEENSMKLMLDMTLSFMSTEWIFSEYVYPRYESVTVRLEKYADAAGKKKETVDELTISSGEEYDNAVIGKFDLDNMALLDTEEYTSYYEVDDGVVFKTSLRPSNATVVLPGFEFPKDRDAQGYNLIGEYTVNQDGLTKAEFFYSQKALEGEHATGLMVPLCVYTFSSVKKPMDESDDYGYYDWNDENGSYDY